MNTRLFSSPPAAVALAALLFMPLLASLAAAQVATQPSPPAAPAFRSALEGYKPYADERIVNWKAANDTTARVGGWRAYAKEASQPESGAKPAADAATPPSSDAGHAKP